MSVRIDRELIVTMAQKWLDLAHRVEHENTLENSAVKRFGSEFH